MRETKTSSISLTYLKLEEFAAHSANVNCLRIGKKACRLFITGGDDYKVNLWAIGKSNSLMVGRMPPLLSRCTRLDS